VNPETSASHPFSVLACFDDTEEGGYAFERAARIAQRVPSSELHLVYVTRGALPAEELEQLAGRLQTYVSEKAASLGGMDGQIVGVHVRNGEPVPEIAQLAAEIEADLIVIGTPAHTDWKAWLTGTTEAKLLQHAPCPVVVAGVKPQESSRPSLAIEPPCPDCLKVRTETRGAQWWCPRHSTTAAARHHYSYRQEIPFATHNSSVVPTGVDM
jgi:nucleotide-binding universal stress UspA family protein